MGCDPAREAQDDWLELVIGSRPRLWVRGPELRIEAATGWLDLRHEAAGPREEVAGSRSLLDRIDLPHGSGRAPDVPPVVIELFDQGVASFDLGCGANAAGRIEGDRLTTTSEELRLTFSRNR
jgi:hypothetical protein